MYTALIVDDNDVNLMVCEELLSIYNIQVATANSGQMALDLASNQSFDIIFLDHVMPGMDGIEACLKLRGLGGEYATIPIIALTGNDPKEYAGAYARAGMNDWLSKPLEPDTIESILKKWLGDNILQSASEQSANTTAPKWFSAIKKLHGMDAVKGVSLLRGNYDAFRKLLGAFYLQRQLKQPLMETFLKQGDLKSYAVEAHSFKGSLYNIGANRLAEQAKKLELLSDKGALTEVRSLDVSFQQALLELANAIWTILLEDNDVSDSPQGNVNDLHKQLSQALYAMEDFETSDAAVILHKLQEQRFGSENDKAIQLLCIQIDAYEFEQVTSSLEALISQL